VGARRGAAVEIERHGLAVPGAMHEHRARARDRGHERLDHGHREGGGDGRVDGVAAALEDAGADARSDGMLRGDQPASDGRSLFRDDHTGFDHGMSGEVSI
jgi:hypothetical protein